MSGRASGRASEPAGEPAVQGAGEGRRRMEGFRRAMETLTVAQNRADGDRATLSALGRDETIAA